MLHVLIHMDRDASHVTSEDIATMLGTNPVVVRRMMAGLRDRGYVASEKGHGGGWKLTDGLKTISLLDVYEAIGSPALFNIGPHTEHPECLVEQSVDDFMAEALGEAEALLRKRFSAVNVADLADDFDRRLEKMGLRAHPEMHLKARRP
jgi:DNA-binding IscR family transcriptional regulator